ncbi:hypothetical protein JXR01_00645 [Candidatus Kaiserbacteria bacterium]|nr:MAG: hypothetical protein JXR01_00645 [Candidatus Kaiserbacteria bacterium]
MKFTLSRSATNLLIRGLFLVFALGSLYGIWDNYEFFLLSPFYFTAFIDLSFAILFLYFVFSFKSVASKTPRYLTYGMLALWAYTVLSGIIGSIVHTQALGLPEAARMAGYTETTFILSELLYVIILPSIVFLLILRLLRKCSK